MGALLGADLVSACNYIALHSAAPLTIAVD